MIGFIFLLLAARQIYIIIKNGLTARQIRPATTGVGSLVLVDVKKSDIIDPQFLAQMEAIKAPHEIKFMVAMDHPQILELSGRGLPIASYNSHLESAIDVINRLTLETSLETILVTDFNVEFNSEALFGLEKLLADNKGPYLIIPQIHSKNITVDCLYTLNPNLALISLFSFKRLTRSSRRPLLTSSEVCMAYRKIDFELFPDQEDWKSSLFSGFHSRAIGLKLCFGEKYFSLYLTEDLKSLWEKMLNSWDRAELSKNYSALAYFIQCLIWAFPVLFFKSHPFYSIGILLLILIYRIFTFIIFQENILSILLHPISSLMWLASLLWKKGLEYKMALIK